VSNIYTDTNDNEQKTTALSLQNYYRKTTEIV